MAHNLIGGGQRLIVFDAAGTRERAPDGCDCASSAGEVVRQSSVVLLSLPDGRAVSAVAGEIASCPEAAGKTVVDTSTIGVVKARGIHAVLRAAGIEYLDAPVSGGVAGARAASLAMMCAGREESLERVRPLLSMIARHIFHVGTVPGQGQAMKLLNNFLAGTGIAATSEAVAFGERVGLDLKTMIDVLNVSTGRNMATADKFPNRVLTGTYDAGFTSRLLLKDLRLYEEAARNSSAASPVAPHVVEVWRRFEDAAPESDITRMYLFLKGLGGDRNE